MTERADAMQALSELTSRISEWRENAKLACALSPLHWLAVHGVSLSAYLSQLDEFESLCKRAIARLQEGQA